MLPLDHLVVIAGPSCCGKSTFIRKFMSGELTAISGALNIENITKWTYQDSYYLDAKSLGKIERSPVKEIVLHWTIPNPTLKLALRRLVLLFAYDKKERMKILKSPKRLTILTLYTSRDSFLDRVEQRRIAVTDQFENKEVSKRTYNRHMRYAKQRKRFYSNSTNLIPIYRRWFSMCETLAVDSMYLVNVERDPVLVSMEKWPEISAQWSGDGRQEINDS